MQNKPNFQKIKMDLSLYLTTDYKDFGVGDRCKNKANQTQIENRQFDKFGCTVDSCDAVAYSSYAGKDHVHGSFWKFLVYAKFQ